MTRPLDGITVLTLEQAVAAPFATRQLADMGARVIKIERPGVGDFARGYDTSVRGLASHFVWINRSKESVALNLKHPDALAVMMKLMAQADVFVQNLAPGAAGRLGLGADELRAKFPKLIVCDISGYGSSGPYRDKKAYDLLIQCETGLVSVTGTPDTPSKAGISAADIAAGMYGFSGVLAALYQRALTGEGSAFEVSLFEALGEWMGYPMYYGAYGGNPPARSGASHAAIGPYGPLKTGDSKEVFLGVQNEREWAVFCEHVLQRPELTNDPEFDSHAGRIANRDKLTSIIEQVFSELTRDQVLERLEANKIANASMNTMQEFFEHPQLKARDRWREVESPVGTLQALVPPITQKNFEPRMDPIPDVGEHTEAILGELGYESSEIERLRAEAAI